jgi:hypothetical protein
MSKRRNWLAAAVLCVTVTPAWAQWANVHSLGVPRTANGHVNMTAPTPRTAAGKPDLSGMWQADKTSGDLSEGFKKGEFPIQLWAEEFAKERQAQGLAEIPTASCLPAGITLLTISSVDYPFKIVQTPDLIVILYEWFGEVRQIFLDGRTVPSDANPTWLGYSTARWDGDTLVVDTTGFNRKEWLDGVGHPATQALHLTERYQRRDVGHLDLLLTIDDPIAYTKPWTVSYHLHLLPDTELLEFVCNENERDSRHFH